MLWEEYYDKVWDWAVSTSVRKLSQVETFGPADEIIEVFQHIAFDDEKAAVRLIKKALAAGVKFSGDQIAELCLICDEAIIEQAVTQSSDTFTTEDLDALYGVCDEEILLEIAGKRKVPLPESLAEFEETFDEKEPIDSEDLATEYDYILDCLSIARDQLQKAHNFSVLDISRDRRALTVMKYALVEEAQSSLIQAYNAWQCLDIPERTKASLPDILSSIKPSSMWADFLFHGLFVEWSASRKINNLLKNVIQAIRMVQNLRDAL